MLGLEYFWVNAYCSFKCSAAHPVEVGVWFTTPQPDAVEIQWEPLLNTQPDLQVIQGGKDG